MRILVIGGGGREHAIAWSLSRSGEHQLFCAPGNPGIGSLATLYPVGATATGDLARLATECRADLVVVGPEAPLVEGLADRLQDEGVPCFGPCREASMLEGSKWFAKEVMMAAGVPTAEGRMFHDAGDALDYIDGHPERYVIKADGLAAGKGVFLPEDMEETAGILKGLFSGKLGDSGRHVVVETRLRGHEVSILAICSGTECVVLPPSRDHKRLGVGDTGPNTGGMGAICPPPGLDHGFGMQVRQSVILPVLRELASRGIDYRGVLYAGLIVTEQGPKVLEFNVRFGDPETQAVLPMLNADLADLFMAAASGESLQSGLNLREGACACVVMSSGGYPSSYGKGYPISGIDRVDDALVFHAGTEMSGGRLVTAGGRVLSVTAVAEDADAAVAKVYEEIGKIDFKDCYYRTDIGG